MIKYHNLKLFYVKVKAFDNFCSMRNFSRVSQIQRLPRSSLPAADLTAEMETMA